MTTKLTLTMDDSVINSAKEYARQEGKSLSDIVSNYFKSISMNDEKTGNISPKVARLKGSINLAEDFDYKKELGSILLKKHNEL